MDTLTEYTLSQSTAFQGRLLRLRVDEARLPDGTTANREVVMHPGGVGIIALTEEDEVLLVKQFRYPYGEIVTEIPAGKREPGEDPLVTGKRELAEETGFRADTFTPLGTLYPTPGYCDEVIYLYLATGLHPTEAHPDADEFLQVERMPLEALVKLALDGQLPDAKTQIAVLKVWLLRTARPE
ncbi:MAG: NUDIX hydrolase [Clostridia bacterium]|nr:NUDIX hydrolase [Clostridia bacterium]